MRLLNSYRVYTSIFSGQLEMNCEVLVAEIIARDVLVELPSENPLITSWQFSV